MARQVSRIHKVEPFERTSWDNQFWPVAGALLLTAGFAVGAIVSALDGGWRWTALLILPAIVAVLLFVLQRLDQRWLRRSLQMAIVLSALIHFLIVILAAVVDVFGAGRPAEVAKPARPRPERVILTSRRDPQPLWKELSKQPTPETEVAETQRSQTSSTAANAASSAATANANSAANESSAAVPNSGSAAPTANSQRIRERSQSQPVEGELSQRASNRSGTPSSANLPTTASAVTPTNQPTPRAPVKQVESDAPSAKSVTREQSASAMPLELTNQPNSAPAVMEKNRVEPSRPTESLALQAESQTTARLKNPKTSLPQPLTPASAAENLAASQPAAAAPVASESTTASERKAVANRTANSPMSAAQPSSLAVPTATTANETAQTKRAANQRVLPSTADLVEAATPAPQLSSRTGTAAQTGPSEQANLESKVAAGTPQTKQALPTIQATSMRETSQRSGLSAMRSTNVQSIEAPSTGVAPQAADSAKRERAESRSADLSALSSSDQPERIGRSQGTQAPQLAAQANTTESAIIAGTTRPSLSSQEAAASQQLAASRSNVGARNVSPGQSELDLGPTRMAPDTVANSQGGGAAAARGEPQMSLDDAIAGTPSTRRAGEQSQALAANSSVDGAAGQPQTAATTDNQASGIQQQEAAGESGRAAAAAGSANSQSEQRDLAAGLAESAQVSGISGGTLSGEGRQRVGREGSSLSGSPLNADELLESPGNRNVSLSRAPATSATIQSDQGGPGDAAAQAAVSEPTVNPGGSRSGSAMAAESNLSDRSERNQAGSAANLATGGPLQLELDAPAGLPGLGETRRATSGNQARGTRADATDLQISGDSRFIRPDGSVVPGVAADAAVSKEAFRERSAAAANGQPTTEAAIELGLDFLARHQRPDGSWSLRDFDRDQVAAERVMSADVAATGLAILAFQGAGYTHREYKHAARLEKAIDWLVAQQESSGLLFEEDDPNKNDYCRFYSHAIATLALTEAYGMTQDPELRQPCQRALDFIARSQDRQLGGWRYFLQPERATSDTSVTGWMMMALQSARLSDLEVDSETWRGIEKWLNMAKDPEQPQLFRYNPFAEDSAGVNRQASRQVSPSMTAVGLLMRHYMGWNREEDRLMSGVTYLQSHLPSMRSQVERDTYYWYYATQVLRHAGGASWDQWNGVLHPLLVDSQVKTGDMAGSWHPFEPVPDRWAREGGRLYVTTMNLLSLEVNYRLLPLYDLE